MSRQSDNSKAGSEGNGDSLLSSYQNSPRKTPEFGSAGPFGDRCTESKSPNCYIFMRNSDSSPESEEQQTSNLKAEYLDRLNLIRQKLANIDIANYGSYYRNCYPYSSSYSPRCQITEISDDSPKGVENSAANESGVSAGNPLDIAAGNTKAIISKNDKINLETENPPQEEDGDLKMDAESKKGYSKKSVNDFLDNIEEPLRGNSSSNCDFKNAIDVANQSPVEDPNSKVFTIKCDAEPDAINTSSELKMIFQYDSTYVAESSMDLIDLNYNPPKKKYCIRESTPKIVMSDGAISLPYHIRVSLHGKDLKLTDQEQLDVDVLENEANKDKSNIDNLENVFGVGEKLSKENNNHIFPEVQVDCFGGGDQENFSNKSFEGLYSYIDKPVGVSSPRKSAGTDNEYQVYFFETVEQSPSESIKSHKTIVTETTVTDSPSRKPKRRRLLLRSAQNKVKPVDKISLWEEIRTMEALTKNKQEESSSSLESYFKDVIVCEDKTDQQEDLVSTGSLDVSPKTKPPARFPSITKITKFCSSVFRKKSQIILEEGIEESRQPMNNLEEKEETKPNNKKRVKSAKAAHMLLNIRKEQDFYVDFGRLTPSNENYSERTTVQEKDDSYYEGFCPLCFCF